MKKPVTPGHVIGLFLFFLIFVQTVMETRAERDVTSDLDLLLNQLNKARLQEAKIHRERKQKFLTEKDKRAQLLHQAREELRRKDKETNTLLKELESTNSQLDALRDKLQERAGNLNEMFGIVRQFSGDLSSAIEDSLVSVQYPERYHFLDELSQSNELPPIGKLEKLWGAFLQEMTESGKVVKFPAQVVASSGESIEKPVTRIGVFTAIADGRFLHYSPATGQLMELPRQPSLQYKRLAQELENTDEGVVPMVIDPTGGSILNLLVQKPTLRERIKQGGGVGYFIIFIGGAGLLLASLRLYALSLTGRKISKQLTTIKSPHPDNPLGRILTIYEKNKDMKVEALELCLDEAILKEVPQLEKGQAIIKLLAAVAPLLGLLGTVIGMIITFQAITLFGTGDPKLMADGISQALVTTALGLIAAIPLLFSHSVVISRSKSIIQILDEQSAGMIAKNIESNQGKKNV